MILFLHFYRKRWSYVFQAITAHIQCRGGPDSAPGPCVWHLCSRLLVLLKDSHELCFSKSQTLLTHLRKKRGLVKVCMIQNKVFLLTMWFYPSLSFSKKADVKSKNLPYILIFVLFVGDSYSTLSSSWLASAKCLECQMKTLSVAYLCEHLLFD